MNIAVIIGEHLPRGRSLPVEDEERQQLAGLVLRSLHQRAVVVEAEAVAEPEDVHLLLPGGGGEGFLRHDVCFVHGRSNDDH